MGIKNKSLFKAPKVRKKIFITFCKVMCNIYGYSFLISGQKFVGSLDCKFRSVEEATYWILFRLWGTFQHRRCFSFKRYFTEWWYSTSYWKNSIEIETKCYSDSCRELFRKPNAEHESFAADTANLTGNDCGDINIEVPSLFDNVTPQRNDNCEQNVESSTTEDTNQTPEKLNFEMLVSTYLNISLPSRSWGAIESENGKLSHF